MMDDDQFMAILTSQRDQGLAHLTAMIERSGVDEFCEFLSSHVMPILVAHSRTEQHGSVAELVVAHMAIIGAVDALLAHRESSVE